MNLLIENNRPVSLVSANHPGLTVSALPRLRPADYTPAIIANLIERDHGPKTAAIYRVTIDAEQRIESLQWRIERAKERDKIGATGETEADVLREREAIRRASNRAEQYIEQLEDDAEIRSYRFDVLPSDYPANAVLTRLQFMRRFTDAERAAIRAARDSGESQDLLDFWELLQLASQINVNDADIHTGVGMLEHAGLIEAGRAEQITAQQ
ncbi:MAG: hypothetical protein COA87_007910 [Halomonas sp.]|nr:hypothetical protein [Halomonas sp.]MBL1267660.1 hypothetical protein [Halomonas sp.]